MLEKISSFPFSHLIRNKSIQNFIFLVIIQASNILISLISMPLLIQSIGVDQFGLVNLALSVIILLNILVGFGYNLSGPREVAIQQGNKEQLSHLFSNIISSKILMAACASLLILIGVFVLDLFKEYQTILVFSCLLLFSEATLPLWFFQGMEKMKLISIANVFSKLLFLMGIVLFIHQPEQAKWVNFLLGGSGFAINSLLLLYVHYEMEIRFYKPRFVQVFKSLKENTLLFLSNLASHISINGGLIVLSFFSAAATLGMFSLAERITMVLRMLPALIIQAIYPNASKLYQDNLPRFFNFLKKTYLIALLLGAGLSVFTFFTAGFIVEILAKERLEEAILFLQILAFVPFLACLNIINVTMLLVTDQKDQLFKASWQMCIYMLIASVALTSQFGGIGLCIALLSTEVVIFLICTILIYKKNKDLYYGFQKALFGSSHHP
ncbi:O-antigen transporter [Indibacter alkaliphilus LW1]|uniref:O-antigen transporter n=1 Tax=Indibacter alkaliphilus (strain CCUG 57479 / KCTC 22604 / LW1) TaxID=1189612 RepID=S2DJ92_INDAL|nr:oligosaccharide flippase family protein [Indibacter alkaliphilus]EOZ92021.1 O-antigen transporter [Indibacter alkaliphilus LW1]